MKTYTHMSGAMQWAFRRACYWRMKYANDPDDHMSSSDLQVKDEATVWGIEISFNEAAQVVRQSKREVRST